MIPSCLKGQMNGEKTPQPHLQHQRIIVQANISLQSTQPSACLRWVNFCYESCLRLPVIGSGDFKSPRLGTRPRSLSELSAVLPATTTARPMKSKDLTRCFVMYGVKTLLYQGLCSCNLLCLCVRNPEEAWPLSKSVGSLKCFNVMQYSCICKLTAHPDAI